MAAAPASAATLEPLGSIRLAIESPAEAAELTARLKLVSGSKRAGARGRETRRKVVARLPKRTRSLAAGEKVRVGWKLDRGERRRARRAVGRSKLTARFTVRGTDAAGNRGPKVKARTKLRR